MRVDLNVGSAVPENTTQATLPARAQSVAAGGSSMEASQFSSSEAGMSALAAAALDAPEVRTAKVEALRQQIASGNYQVSSHQIATSILEQLLPTRGQNGN